jgi:hypothetical protein
VKVGDLVRSRTSCESIAVVVKAHERVQFIRVLFLKSGSCGTVNKYAFEVLSDSLETDVISNHPDPETWFLVHWFTATPSAARKKNRSEWLRSFEIELRDLTDASQRATLQE